MTELLDQGAAAIAAAVLAQRAEAALG